MNQNKNYVLPLAIIGLFFFSLGFALGINSYLMPVLKNAMNISGAASSLLLAATFIPFLLLGIPATWCIRKIGYKRTMALSFLIFAVAFGLFILAAMDQSCTSSFCQSLYYDIRSARFCCPPYFLYGHL